jgi:hypothetical protein
MHGKKVFKIKGVKMKVWYTGGFFVVFIPIMGVIALINILVRPNDEA